MAINIINGDSRHELKKLPDSSVDLVVTSPPYKDEDGYTDQLIHDVFSQTYRIQKPSTLLFLNFGHLAGFKSRPFKVVSILEEIGYELNDTIIWTKTQYRPIQGNKRLNNLTEFIFLFNKGKMPDIDRLAIGIEYADKTNIKRYAKDKDLKCPGNSWNIGYETINSQAQKLHNDRFPLELPTRCIKLSGLKTGTVLEPFAGSGTTLLACKNLGLDAIGIERNKSHIKTIQERLK